MVVQATRNNFGLHDLRPQAQSQRNCSPTAAKHGGLSPCGGVCLLNLANDRNMRAIVLVTNPSLTPGETSSSVAIDLIDSNAQTYAISAGRSLCAWLRLFSSGLQIA